VPWISNSTFVAHGFLGVEFFFIISGFVIALTLQSTSSLLDFAVKRFARLFPAMLACSVTTYIVVSLLGVSPFSDVNLIDFLPSLTFVSPIVYNNLFGLNTDWISGVYWSLFVEVKFYVFASIIYFFSPKSFLRNYLIFSIIFCLTFWCSQVFGINKIEKLLLVAFYPQYAGFFVAGMAFQRLFQAGGKFEFDTIIIVGIGVVYSLLLYSPTVSYWNNVWYSTGVIMLFFALFWSFSARSPLTKVFEAKWLAKIGAASYSLYLLHQSVGISLANRMNALFGTSLLWTLLAIAFVIALSIFFYDYVESPARRVIRRLSAKFVLPTK